jgi:5-methylcytosine-specific restriction protein A
MATYIYTWNPKLWNWFDFRNAITLISAGEKYDCYWSCGNTKKIRVGDEFLLMRLGVDPKGIIGVGKISSEPYLLPHWDTAKAAQGQNVLRTDLLFQALAEKPFILLAALQREYGEFNWTPQASGITVPQEIASKIVSGITQATTLVPVDENELATYAEGKTKVITLTTYERNPRARQACLNHHGFSCSVCGFNFGAVFGAVGESYIEVHHLRQIADRGEEHQVDPINDLRPVCANCHRMLHRRRPPYGIEDIKKLVMAANILP